MMRRRFIYSVLAAVLTLALGSCADDADVFGIADETPGDSDVSVTLSFSDFEIQQINSRSAQLPSGYTYAMYVVYYNSAGNQISYTTLSLGTPNADNEYEVTLRNIPASTSTIHFFHGNSTSLSFYVYSGISTLENLKWFSTDSWTGSTASGGALSEVTWGAVKKADLLKGGTKVSMLASYARVTVENDADAFTMESYGVYNTAIRGYWTTESLSSENVPTAPRLPSIPGYSFGVRNSEPMESLMKTSGYIPVFDSAKGNGRIIIKGSYKGKTGYYVARFATRSPEKESTDEYPSEVPGNFTYTDIDVVRNHQYTLKIEYVRAEGWGTLAEALAAEPDNRMTVMMEDRNLNIKDIVSCRDYAMGVTSAELTVDGDAATVELDVVSNYLPTTKPAPAISADAEWIKSADAETTLQPGTYNLGFEGGAANGYCHHVSVPLETYTDDVNPRTGHITVRVGDLERTITLTQKPRDYIHEASRKVAMRIYSATNSIVLEVDDYFAWVDRTSASFCYGARPEDNRGAARNDGLIFPPAPNLYAGHIEYYIPYEYGDDLEEPWGYEVDNSTYIGSTRYWCLKQKYDPTEISTGNSFLLTNSYDDTKITYPVYQTGFFHELTADMAQYQAGADTGDSSRAKTGWYYYEMARLGSSLLIADRNLGATSNSPYISTYSGYRDNEGAVGGYFKAAYARYSTSDYSGDYWTRTDYVSDKTITAKLNLGSALRLPTHDELSSWNIVLSKPDTGASGTAANVACIVPQSSKLADNKVFIPHGGYYEGDSHQLSTRANLWTSTIYCSAQGFHPDQSRFPNNNFGFWYYYLDGQISEGHQGDISQIRCTDGVQADFSDSGVFRYMPVRLVATY